MKTIKYSIQNKDQVFASKYKTYLPSKEELTKEIEEQKKLYLELISKK